MAKQLPALYIYPEMFSIFELLSDADIGVVFKALYLYAVHGLEPELTGASAFAWPMLKLKVDEAQQKYTEKCEKNRENVKKRYDRIRTNTTVYDGIQSNTNATTVYENYERIRKLPTETKTETKTNNIPPNPQGGLCAEVVEHLNQRIGSHFRANTKSTAKHINARIREGFTLDDFKTVIDFKAGQWEHDPQQSQYLRPDTLFGTKMESYLEAARRSKPEPKAGGDIYAGLL